MTKKYIENKVPETVYEPMEIEFSLVEKARIYYDKFKFILKVSPALLTLAFRVAQLINVVKKKEEFKMTQSTLDTIKGVVRAVVMVVAIFFIKDLPIDTVVTSVMSVIAAVYGLWELISGLLSNSNKIKK